MGKDLVEKYVNMTYFGIPHIFYSILLTTGVAMNEMITAIHHNILDKLVFKSNRQMKK